jgi:hypothetical protein
VDNLVEYLAANPSASRQEVMKACAASAKLVRQAEETIELGRASRRRRRWLTLLALGAALLLVGGAYVWAERSREAEDARRRQEEARVAAKADADKRSIYEALDGDDPRLVEESLTRLEAKDEALRVAALRYLAKIGDPRHTERLLLRVDDPSSRVRLVAIQAAGNLPGSAAQDALVSVASSAERPVNERMLALDSLKGLRGAGSLALARRLVPLVGDPSVVVRTRTASALQRLTGKQLERRVEDPQGAQAAWRGLLGEGSQ